MLKKNVFGSQSLRTEIAILTCLLPPFCTPIILNACRYFHKRLNIQSHILYDSYHMSPLIQAALSVSALNRSMGLNLFKCAPFSTLTPLTFAFLCTCPEASSSKERRRIGRPPSSWQLNTVEVLDLCRGIGPAELCHGRQVAGAAEWEKECGRMEGDVVK